MLTLDEKRLVGGSDVSAIVGVSPYGSAYAVWERIVHGVERGDSSAMSRGRRLEPVVLDWYAEHTGRMLTRDVRMRDPARPHIRVSFDALGERMRGVRGVEAKTAGSAEAHKWGEDGTDEVPAFYLCQTQVYLGEGLKSGRVTDDVWDVPVLLAGDFRLYHVRYDAETYGLLSEAVDRFWVDHVVTKNPPEVTALPNDLEALKRRFPRETDAKPLDFSSLPPEAQVTLEEYLRAYAEEAAASDRRALWEARAKMIVGGAPGVRGLPEGSGFHRLDWRQSKAGEATDWKAVLGALDSEDPAFAARMRALVKQHTKTREGNRPFTPRAITKGRK